MKPLRSGLSWGVGFTSAIAAIVGVRAVASLGPGGATPLLRAEPLPRVDHGLEWTDGALWPADLQVLGSDALVRLLVVMALAVVVVALLNTVILLAEGASGRRRREAVRLALGIDPRAHDRTVLRAIAVVGLGSTSLGLAIGLAAGWALRQSWPGSVAPWGTGAPGAVDAGVALVLAAAIVVAAQRSGVRSVRRPGVAAGLLRGGGRTGDEPAAVFVRSALSVAHVAVGASALLVAMVSRGALPEGDAGASQGDAWVLATEGVADRSMTGLLHDLRAIDGVASVSDSAPGALVGLGLRDLVVTECGDCWRSMLPAPLWSALADHHVVGPGWFEPADVELLEGRTFAESDATEVGPVAVVDELLAATAFEDGEAIGRRLRVGRDYETWYTVIGIVADKSEPVVGEDGRRETVYLSTRQLAVSDPRLVMVASEEGVDAAAAILEESGLRVTFSGTLTDYVSWHAAAFGWLGRMGGLLAFVALLLAVHGTWTASLQSTRRRRAEFALRQAVGANRTDLIALALRERVGIVLWGLMGFALLGTALLALLRGDAFVGVTPYLWAAATVSALSLGSAMQAALESAHIEPGVVLD